MSNQSIHHHTLVNSLPQTSQQHPHQPSLTAQIHPENDSEDDVVPLPTVPKVLHSPDDYDPECQCSTCKLATKLLAECTCEQCKGTEQPNRSTENAVSPTNGQSSSSSIQNNDASTSEHTNSNDRDDDRESRSSTPDYLPRFFNDESGDSSSNDSEDYVVNCKKLDQESVSDSDDENNDDPEYVFARPSKSSKRSKSSSKHSKTSAFEKIHKCPLCNKCFTEKHNLKRHYLVIHQQLKPYYCKWPKCEFVSGRHDSLINHITVKHFNRRKNANKVNLYVGKRKLACNRAASGACNQAKGDESNTSGIDSDDDEKDSVSDKSPVDSASNQINSLNCPKCKSNFDERGKLLCHYRFVHLQWKPFYCKWLKCDFEEDRQDRVVNHAYRKHLNMKSLKKATNYVGKREWSFSSQADPIYESVLGYTSFNSNCPKCGRNFTHAGHFRRHLGSHKKGGFCCTWLQCGFFFSELQLAKKHVLGEHFQGKLVNASQLNENLIKVEPNLSKKLHNTVQNNDASTSEHRNANDQNDDRELRSSTPDYLPRFFDEESGDSSLDDCEVDDSVDDENDKELDLESKNEENNDNSNSDYAFNDTSSDDSEDYSSDNMNVVIESESLNSIVYSRPNYQNASVINFDTSNSSDNESTNSKVEGTGQTSVNCPKCAMTFTLKNRLLRHYRGVHQEWKPYYCRWPKCSFASPLVDLVVHHANRTHFKSQNRQNAKNYVGKREETPPKDPVLEQIDGIKFRKKGFGQTRSSCPKCGRNLYLENLKKHIRTHANPGYSCAWPNCGFFYSMRAEARKHLYAAHLRVETANSQQTKRYLVKVNTRIGKTRKVAPKHNQKTTTFNSNCPKCSRNFRHRGHFKRHLRIHTKKGFRCTWPQCGFFYPSYQCAQMHLLKDHYKGKLVNATQISEHVIEVDPNSNGIHHTIQNNDESPNEHTNTNVQDDNHSRSSTPEYLPQLFDDESGDSSSNESENDDQENESGDNDSDDSVDDDDDGESSEM